MDALIQEAKDLCAQALDQADEALATIQEARDLCDSILENKEAA